MGKDESKFQISYDPRLKFMDKMDLVVDIISFTL